MNKKPTLEKEPLISEEDKQNDPVIRTIFKKVRNMTKKISDIEALEGRADLKPEQVEKVKSKTSIVDDRKKYEDFAKFYKTIINENAAETKGQVNPEYVKIAQLLALSHFLTVNPDSNAVNTLNEAELKIVTGFLKDVKPTETLGERTERLGQTIRNYMENNALVNKVGQLMTDKTFSANTHQKTYASLQPVEPTKKEAVQAPAPEPVAPTPQPEPVKQVVAEAPKVVATPKVEEKPAVVETPAPQNPTPQPAQVQQPAKETKQVKEEKENVDAPVQKQPTQTKVVAPTPAVEKVEENTAKETPKTENEGQEKRPFKKAQNRGEYQPDKKRTYRPKEGNGNYQDRGEGRGEGRGGEGRGEYKPRGNYRGGDGEYRGNRGQRRQNDRDEDRSDTSLESSGEKRREFNKDERRELEDDGFMIVGGGAPKTTKYRPRPKDVNETRAYHKKQHGYREKKQ